MRQNTRQLSTLLRCTPQAINKAVRKACEVHNIDPSEFGSPDPQDKRIRTFPETEIELILKYAPKPKLASETVSETVSETIQVVEPEQLPPLSPTGLVLHAARPMMQLDIQTLNVNIVVHSTEQLDDEAQNFNQLTTQAFNALRKITKDELKNSISEMRAQNKHAVAGIQAAAAVEVVQELVNDQRSTTDQPVPAPNMTETAR
jgi:hypothetical protein